MQLGYEKKYYFYDTKNVNDSLVHFNDIPGTLRVHRFGYREKDIIHEYGILHVYFSFPETIIFDESRH